MIQGIVVYVLSFVSIGLFLYEAIPLVLQAVEGLQGRRLNKLSGNLEGMFIFEISRECLLMIGVLAMIFCATTGFKITKNPLGVFGGLFIGFFTPPIYVNYMK